MKARRQSAGKNRRGNDVNHKTHKRTIDPLEGVLLEYLAGCSDSITPLLNMCRIRRPDLDGDELKMKVQDYLLFLAQHERLTIYRGGVPSTK